MESEVKRSKCARMFFQRYSQKLRIPTSFLRNHHIFFKSLFPFGFEKASENYEDFQKMCLYMHLRTSHTHSGYGARQLIYINDLCHYLITFVYDYRVIEK